MAYVEARYPPPHRCGTAGLTGPCARRQLFTGYITAIAPHPDPVHAPCDAGLVGSPRRYRKSPRALAPGRKLMKKLRRSFSIGSKANRVFDHPMLNRWWRSSPVTRFPTRTSCSCSTQRSNEDRLAAVKAPDGRPFRTKPRPARRKLRWPQRGIWVESGGARVAAAAFRPHHQQQTADTSAHNDLWLESWWSCAATESTYSWPLSATGLENDSEIDFNDQVPEPRPRHGRQESMARHSHGG